MQTVIFLRFLAGALVVGGVLGGTFVGGVALGNKQTPEPAAAVAGPTGTQATGGSSTLTLEQLREQIQSGELDPEQLAELRQQFQGGLRGGPGGGGVGGGGFGGGGFGGRGGLTGTIEEIDGDTVTIDTPQGPLQAVVGPETTIRVTTEGTLADLDLGANVTVIGQRGDDGTVNAVSIILTPEGGSLFGGGGFGGGFGGEQQPAP